MASRARRDCFPEGMSNCRLGFLPYSSPLFGCLLVIRPVSLTFLRLPECSPLFAALVSCSLCFLRTTRLFDPPVSSFLFSVCVCCVCVCVSLSLSLTLSLSHSLSLSLTHSLSICLPPSLPISTLSALTPSLCDTLSFFVCAFCVCVSLSLSFDIIACFLLPSVLLSLFLYIYMCFSQVFSRSPPFYFLLLESISVSVSSVSCEPPPFQGPRKKEPPRGFREHHRLLPLQEEGVGMPCLLDPLHIA